jgi:4-amino-4-deoxy-L-arabinose transferase-like glycosyltransferase
MARGADRPRHPGIPMEDDLTPMNQAGTRQDQNAVPASLARSTQETPAVIAHWPVLGVIALFLASLFIVPTFADVAVGDDWVYTRSVEILVNDGQLKILDLSVVTLVFQVFWGALFSLADPSFAAMRLSTIVIVLLSGGAMYGLLRELGVMPGRAALGTALYLFNPLTYGLAFTFMTDPHFTALLVIAMWLYVRGLHPERFSPRWILLGSVAASLAFLVRQQGALIPLAVGLYLVLAGRWRPNAAGFRLAVIVAGVPAGTMVAYYAWLLLIHGAPEQQGAFLDQMTEAGVDESRILVSRMAFIAIAYIGFFVLPLAVAALPRLRPQWLPGTWPGRVVVALWAMAAIAGWLIFAGRGKYMPYIPQYFSLQGIGPTDVRGGRAWLVDGSWGRYLTYVCLVSTIAFALLLARRLLASGSPDRASASLLVMIGLWQFIGALPPSFHFRNWIISVDRYLLPLLPVAIALLLWALRDVRLVMPLAWVLVALLAAFSIAAARDFFVFQEATWDMAEQAVDMGVPLTKLDGGASWDGYYLYDYSMENGIETQTSHGPWWTDLFGPATDSTYVVSTRVLPGYDVVREMGYASWLEDDDLHVFLLREQGVTQVP